MNETFKIAGILAFISFTFAATAEIHYTNEFWISAHPTGNIYPPGGKRSKPLDGSTETNFDLNMSNLPPYCVIHILPGTYQTYGGLRWGAKTGQKIVGSGMKVTTLQLSPGTPNTTVICSLGLLTRSVGSVSNVIISDLTCDCNYSSGSNAYNGVNLYGTENRVSRVKIKNESFVPKSNSEAWGISLCPGPNLSSSWGNIIEDCEVDPLVLGHNITAIGLMGGLGHSVSGIMRNNHVFLTPDPNGAQLAFNTAWVTDSRMEGNLVDGADCGYCSDTGGATNVIFTHNTFTNVYAGFLFWNFPRENLKFTFNKISLCPTNYYFSAAFGFPDGIFHTNVVIEGNNVGFDGKLARTAPSYFLYVSNVVGLVIRNNKINSNLDNYVSAAGLILSNNHVLRGDNLTNSAIPSSAQKP